MGIELGIPFQNQSALSMFMGKTTSIKSYLWLKDCPLPDLIVWVREPGVTPRRSHGWFDLNGDFQFFRVSKTWYSCIIWWPYCHTMSGICPILKQIHTWEYDGIWHILVAKQMSQHHTIYSASEALQEPWSRGTAFFILWCMKLIFQ